MKKRKWWISNPRQTKSWRSSLIHSSRPKRKKSCSKRLTSDEFSDRKPIILWHWYFNLFYFSLLFHSFKMLLAKAFLNFVEEKLFCWLIYSWFNEEKEYMRFVKNSKESDIFWSFTQILDLFTYDLQCIISIKNSS